MYVVNNIKKRNSLWTWSCFIDEILNDDENIIIYGEDELSKFNKNKLSLDKDELYKDEKIIGDEILFITLNDLKEYKKQLSLFTSKSVIIPYDDITNESLSLCKDHGVNFIYTDILPDEISDTVDDVNYSYFTKTFIFVEPSIKQISDDEETDLLVICCSASENFGHLELIIKSLNNAFKIKQLKLEEINLETVLPKYKTVLTTAANPNVFHLFFSKNKNNCFLLNENSTFSPLRYFFYDDNTAPTEIQNHISFKSIRSLTHTIISSLSSDYVNCGQNLPIYTKTIKDKQQLINIYHKPHILEQAWRYRRTIDDLVKYPEVCFTNYSKRAFYLYNSILNSEKNKNSNLRTYLEDVFINFQISDEGRKFDRDFHNLFQNEPGKLNEFITKTLTKSLQYKDLMKIDICKIVLGKISNLSIFQGVIYNKKIMIQPDLLDALYNNSKKDIFSSTYFFHIKSCIDVSKIQQVSIHSHQQFCTISFASILIFFDEFSKANVLLKNIKSNNVDFDKKCKLLLKFMSFDTRITLDNNVLSLLKDFKSSDYSKEDFLELPLIFFYFYIPYTSNLNFFYNIYKHLQNGSVIPEHSIDLLFSKNKEHYYCKDFIAFFDEIVATHFHDLPSYNNDPSLPRFIVDSM